MANKARMERGVLRFIFLMLLFPIYLISKIIPKDKQLYIFGSSLGYHFADNSKYLFLYASENIKHIKSVFISKNKDVVNLIIDKGMKAEYVYSYKGIKTILRAQKAFLSHSTEDIHPILLGGTKIIQLWHGTPLKHISYDADWSKTNIKLILKNMIRKVCYTLFPYLYSSTTFDVIIVSSDFITSSFKSAFRISEEKISVMGQPRNDCLSQKFNLNNKFFNEIESIENLKSKSEFIISWLPTHRKPAPINIVNLMSDYGFNKKNLNDRLKKLNAILVIKPHFLELNLLNEYIKDSTNIHIYDEVDPYPLMRYTDILITDYSSIYFDYLLLNKPIIFTPFDYDSYLRLNAAFYYNYNEVTPGPKCKNWIEVAEELDKIIRSIKIGEKDFYFESRIKIKKLFNKYDADFSKRIVENYF